MRNITQKTEEKFLDHGKKTCQKCSPPGPFTPIYLVLFKNDALGTETVSALCKGGYVY